MKNDSSNPLLGSSLARDIQGHKTSVFCCENQRENCFLSWRSASDWVFWRPFAKVSSGKFRSIDFYSIDLLRAKFDRSTLSSIDRVLQNFRIFQAIPHEFCHSSLIDLQNIKTQKLTKASENNRAKGLTNVNQGVQIHNIWHSSNTPKHTFC
jgi:hypothetical protein